MKTITERAIGDDNEDFWAAYCGAGEHRSAFVVERENDFTHITRIWSNQVFLVSRIDAVLDEEGFTLAFDAVEETTGEVLFMQKHHRFEEFERPRTPKMQDLLLIARAVLETDHWSINALIVLGFEEC